jgi:hypothetical protein
MQFTEDASKPHSRDYTFSFIVTRTTPDLADYMKSPNPYLSGFDRLDYPATEMVF